MHGIGALLPWNMLIDGVDYFEYKLNQSEHHQHHRNQNHLLFKYIEYRGEYVLVYFDRIESTEYFITSFEHLII
ncbi:hypothetical protein QR98_0069420 [Sarcoptes scabiei]|uniref:Uncharacterized protein n=1 Tax=Sarcoptes scabiei TaxID=52283 RepID=A0A132ACX0_SARSC|nr:hypothetical protein QR98_0069420 [Sarcoptes scabiei]